MLSFMIGLLNNIIINIIIKRRELLIRFLFKILILSYYLLSIILGLKPFKKAYIY